ncbi:MAG: glycosyltransferase family 9 protein [Candidatus Aenigmatarchaeota archaeon]
MKIVIIKGSSIGDAVLAIPLLRNVRKNYPDAEITLVTEDSVAGLGMLEKSNYADKIVQIKKKSFLSKLGSLRKIAGLVSSRYDIVILGMPVTEKKIRLAKMFKAMKTIAPERELYEKHEKSIVDVDLEMLKTSGIPIDDGHLEVFFDEKTMQRLENAKIDKKSIAIYPGRDPDVYRKWYDERWIELVDKLREKYDVSIIGGSECFETAHNIAKSFGLKTNVANLAGRTTLEQTAVLLKKSRLFITTNGGPMHLAAALGVPMVVLHTSSADMWLPRTRKAVILKGKCKNKCPNDWCRLSEESRGMCQDISVKNVEKAVRKMLRK